MNIQRRSNSQLHMEVLVSVEGATRLQDVSMRRFQNEAAGHMKLRQVLGHISINRRSTEIIKTATFDEEIIDELDMIDIDSVYDNDAPSFEPSLDQPVLEIGPAEVPPTPDSNLIHQTEEWMSLPLLAEQIVTATSNCNEWARYMPKPADIAAMGADPELLLSIEEDWMYDVLNLHVDCDPLLEPMSTQPLSKSVVIQLWKMVLESLTGFANNRKVQMESNRQMSHLEAFGIHEPNMLVGLGLNCHVPQSDLYGGLPQLAT